MMIDHAFERLCHMGVAAYTVISSPFESGLAVVADEYGELNSVTIAEFKEGGFKIIKEIPYPHSLGVFYATFTWISQACRSKHIRECRLT